MQQQQQTISTCIHQVSSTTDQMESFGSSWKAWQTNLADVLQQVFSNQQQTPRIYYTQQRSAYIWSTWMSYFFLKRRQQQTRFSKQFSNTCFFDEQDATLPTEETTMNLDWQTATTTHFLRKQKWRTANQQQLQEQHRTPTADHKQPLSKD